VEFVQVDRGVPHTTTGNHRAGQFWINHPSRVFIARNGRHELTNLMLSSAQVDAAIRPTSRPR
jgi:hypothetical protein